MRKIRYIVLSVLCAVCISACQDDLVENTSTGGADINKPVKVELKLNVPDEDEINMSRAVSYENSSLGDLHLFIFSGNAFLGDEQVTSANIQRTDNANRNVYTISATLYEGEQTVYAVGNVTTQTNYWDNPVNALREAAENGKDDFLNTLYNVRQDVVSGGFVTFPGNYRPLAGSGEVTVQDGSANGTIYMKREVARIKLNVNMTYTVRESGERYNNQVTFTPQTYSVYNVASKGYVMETDENAQREGVSEGFYPVENMSNFNVSDGQVATIGDGFNIPENIQQPIAQGTTYADRDKWNSEGNEGAADDEKTWTYASPYATYIVIKGNYVETTADGQVVYSGPTSYTFHLGEWSGNGFGNFNVERNTIYTYTVSIHGVENMIVEVETEVENQPGAEGDIIELGQGSEVFNLDAHYEQVYVEYNLSDIADVIRNGNIGDEQTDIDNAIARNFMLSIHSPMNTAQSTEELALPYIEDETERMRGIDYEWIHFYSQNSRNRFSTYTSTKDENDQYLLSPWDACKKMGEAVKDLIDNADAAPSVTGLRTVSVTNGSNTDYYACFTVFVNEYFYTKDLEDNKVSWEKFARAEPRTLLIASNWEPSPDGNTTYATARTYISQVSILTFYNTAAAQETNALGIESYNEYGVITGFGNSASSYYEKTAKDNNAYNGRANMLLDIEGRDWDDIPFARIGYLNANPSSDDHLWDELTDNDRTNSAYYACMSRNRDLNRNGQIDNDEVRWYLPARSQYLRMGIGANSFNTDVQLYNGNKANLGQRDDEGNQYPLNQLDKGTLYYSNTPYTKGSHYDPWELYWAVEVGAYGSNWDPNDTGTYGRRAQIRCVRNLPAYEYVNDNDSYSDVALAGPVYGKLKRLQGGNQNYFFDFGNRMTAGINRTSPFNGPYNSHNEMSEQNRLYKAFVVADRYIQSSNNVNETFTAKEAASEGNDNPCASYSENGAPVGTWRTPNLNELTVMSTVAEEIGLVANTMSSTTFSNSNVRGLFNYNGSMITAWNPDYGSGPIRCVRDATDLEIQNAVPVN